jgi:hypothetical protein
MCGLCASRSTDKLDLIEKEENNIILHCIESSVINFRSPQQIIANHSDEYYKKYLGTQY